MSSVEAEVIRSAVGDGFLSLLFAQMQESGHPRRPKRKAPEPNPRSRAFTLGRGFRTRPGSMSRFAPKRNHSQTDAVTVGHEMSRSAMGGDGVRHDAWRLRAQLRPGSGGTSTESSKHPLVMDR